MTNQDRSRSGAARFRPVQRRPDNGRTTKAQDRLARATLYALVCVPVLAAASIAWAQSSQFRWDEVRATLLSANQATASFPQRDDQDNSASALADFAKSLSGPVDARGSLESDHRDAANRDHAYQSLLSYVQQLGGERPKLAKADLPDISADLPPGHPAVARDDADSSLIAFVQQISPGEPDNPIIKVAEAKKSKNAAKSVLKAAPDAEATFVGQQACLGCHATHAATFGRTLMGRIFRNPRTAQEKGGCETCHGAGSLHVKAGGGRGVGGIISFRKDDTSRSVADNNAICLSCHDKGDRINWQGSTHESREVACTNCHTVMADVSPKFQLKTVSEVDTCFQCHKNKRAEMWRSSHMPVREGKMTCSSCHNPHGSFSEALLKEATGNDTCYKCHAEKRGPFLFEHAPVRENCMNCHEPHGSNNDFLLKISRPRLCQQCHGTISGHPGNPRNPASVYAINRECQNCHSQHHGSNSPSGARFQR
jgi:DmsE family decaheme c-type cytochrome